MLECEINFSKNSYILKRLNDFYFQVTSVNLPSSLVVISDLKYVFMGPKETFCEFCFKHRYLCFVSNPHLGGQNQLSLPDNWCSKNNTKLFEIIESEVGESWKLCSIDNNECTDFELVPYELCDRCCPIVFIETPDVSEGEELKEQLLKKLEAGGGDDTLVAFLENNSFGFISFLNVFSKAGFSDPTLEKLLGGQNIATLLTHLPASGDSEAIMCGAQDSDKNLVKLKAAMEFLERYALHNKSFKSRIARENPDSVICCDKETFTTFFDDNVINKKIIDTNFIWGLDVLKAKASLVPLNFIYGFDDQLYASNSSGFAAHYDAKKALEGSVFELIERDAFVRFWFNPESVQVLEINDGIKKTLETIIDVLGKILGNDQLTYRVLLLPSKFSVPSVLVFITSQNPDMPPAFLIGSSSEYSLDVAIGKAIKEVRTEVLNFIAKLQSDPECLNREININDISSIKDHMHLYFRPEMISKLKFLKPLLNKKPVIYKEMGSADIEELKDEFRANNIGWYAIDATPVFFDKLGVTVIRSFSTGLYPLQFGYPMKLDTINVSELSVAREVPHPFT